MGDRKNFLMPDVGEGLTEADIIRWDVAVGDRVEINQTLLEVETAKASVELPSPFAGIVTELHHAVGTTVPVGQPIVTVEVAPAGEPTAGDPVAPATAGHTEAEREPVLVGYGVGHESGRRRRRVGPPASTATTTATTPAVTVPADRPVLAKPPVRKLAKELGVDLADVDPSGPNGSVSRADVQHAADSAAATRPVWLNGPSAPSPLADGVRVGAETRIPIRGVRMHTANAMVQSAFTAPHVTEFVTVDVTETMALRDRVTNRPEFDGVRVSPMLFVIRGLLWALRRNPLMNSTWDADANEIVVKHYVNLGVAAATDRGLVVPNIKNAGDLSLIELARELNDLTVTARNGRTTPASMRGGTITISNVGPYGVDTGTPILNPGETTILLLGAIRRQPWVVGTGEDERIEPRWITQLAISFDHRVVDGQQGSQFLFDLAAVLSDPGLAML